MLIDNIYISLSMYRIPQGYVISTRIPKDLVLHTTNQVDLTAIMPLSGVTHTNLNSSIKGGHKLQYIYTLGLYFIGNSNKGNVYLDQAVWQIIPKHDQTILAPYFNGYIIPVVYV